jgi:hypothetical protein
MRNYFGSGAKRTDHATSRTYQAQEGDIAPDMPWRVKTCKTCHQVEAAASPRSPTEHLAKSITLRSGLARGRHSRM